MAETRLVAETRRVAEIHNTITMTEELRPFVHVHGQRRHNDDDDDDMSNLSEQQTRGGWYRFKLSPIYIVGCIVIALMSLAVIIDVGVRHLMGDPLHWYTLVLDGIATFTITAETIVDMGVEGRRFWRRPWNIFDFIVSSMSVVCFILFLLEMLGHMSNSPESIALTVIVLRYVFQIFRVSRYIRTSYESRRAQEIVNDSGKVLFDEPQRQSTLL